MNNKMKKQELLTRWTNELGLLLPRLCRDQCHDCHVRPNQTCSESSIANDGGFWPLFDEFSIIDVPEINLEWIKVNKLERIIEWMNKWKIEWMQNWINEWRKQRTSMEESARKEAARLQPRQGGAQGCQPIGLGSLQQEPAHPPCPPPPCLSTLRLPRGAGRGLRMGGLIDWSVDWSIDWLSLSLSLFLSNLFIHSLFLSQLKSYELERLKERKKTWKHEIHEHFNHSDAYHKIHRNLKEKNN